VLKAKQELETSSELQERWSWVETSIWTERMLAALENGVKGGKWFSLWDKVYAPKVLLAAWKQVAKNKGASGVDGISIKRFKRNEENYLRELHEKLKIGRYQPQAVKRVYIPKSGGKRRPLGIPVIKDRIVQTAMKMVIEPIFERDFMEISYGFRPNKGAKDALRAVDRKLKEGYVWVVDADTKACFDNIPHEILYQKVKERISDGMMLRLINNYLSQPILEELTSWTPTKGTPQGAVLSPLLANIYLHGLDQELKHAGHEMVRYADDFVTMCKTEEEAQRALKKIKRWLTKHELELHPDKTRIGNCQIKGQGFEFLGYRFEAGHRNVRKKSRQNMRCKIKTRTKRTRGDCIRKMSISNMRANLICEEPINLCADG